MRARVYYPASDDCGASGLQTVNRELLVRLLEHFFRQAGRTMLIRQRAEAEAQRAEALQAEVELLRERIRQLEGGAAEDET